MIDEVKRTRKVLSRETFEDGLIFERVHEHIEMRIRVCPHCGGLGHAKEVDFAEYDEPVKIECEKCGVHSGVYDTYENAVSIWNKRVNAVADVSKKKVKTCAFCGGKADIEYAPEYDEDCGYIRSDLGLPEDTEMYCVECEKCGASTGYYQTPREALQVWNRRV